jgi:hypothetical protein
MKHIPIFILCSKKQQEVQPPLRPVFDSRSGNVGTVADKMALASVFSQYSGFPYQFSFHQLLASLNNKRKKRKKRRTPLSALALLLTCFLPAFTFLGA